MALLLAAYHRRRTISRRVFRDRNDPLDYMEDDEILRKYRLDRFTIFDLCNELQESLQRPTHRTQSLPVSLQVSLALRFFATGSFQSVIADSHGVSVHSVSRSIHAVAYELTQRISEHVRFPTTAATRTVIKQGFYNISGFPNVIGVVDGTFVPIKRPSVDEHRPGSTHDAYMWNNCTVSRFLEEEVMPNNWLLGDSAYPLKPYLMTPVQRPTELAQQRYNTSHKRTRCTIERTYGIWKARFRCLDKSAGYLMYTPVKCVNIIGATGVLHNICIRKRIPLQDEHSINDSNDDDDNDADNANLADGVDGRIVRNTIILNTFACR